MTVAPSPRVVTTFEGKLLRILRAVVKQAPIEPALPLVVVRTSRPPALTRTCVELVGDSLAKGCVLFLARAGGWRRERSLHRGSAVEGRLWERWRTDELPLRFS